MMPFDFLLIGARKKTAVRAWAHNPGTPVRLRQTCFRPVRLFLPCRPHAGGFFEMGMRLSQFLAELTEQTLLDDRMGQ